MTSRWLSAGDSGGGHGRGYVPGFKDLHLSNVCISSILVIGEDADLKEERFHWSVHERLKHLL